MLARVFIGHKEVGMAVVHGLPTEQPSRTYTFAGANQPCIETLHQHKEIRCDLYCKTTMVGGAFLTSGEHTKKFRFRDYMTGELYDGYSYISGTVEFSKHGLLAKNCWFVSGEGSEPEPIYPQTFQLPVGFTSDEVVPLDAVLACKNLIEIQMQGEAIAAMNPEGEITVFKEAFNRAAEYLAQCFGPSLFSGPILKMPQEEAPPEEEEKIDGYKEGWDF